MFFMNPDERLANMRNERGRDFHDTHRKYLFVGPLNFKRFFFVKQVLVCKMNLHCTL